MLTQGGIGQGQWSRNRWGLGWLLTEDGVLLAQGGISQGRRARKRWELGWVQTKVGEDIGGDLVALSLVGGRASDQVSIREEILSDGGAVWARPGVLVSEERFCCREDSDT